MTKNETSKTVMQGSYYYCTTTCQQVFFEDINELCLAVDNIWVIKNNFIQFLEPERQKQVIRENAEQIAFYRTREAYRFTKEYNDLLDAQIDSYRASEKKEESNEYATSREATAEDLKSLEALFCREISQPPRISIESGLPIWPR